MSKLEELLNKFCPGGVEYKSLGAVLSYEQPSKYIVSNTDYKDEYNTPVLTAGQTFILGYTNEQNGIYKASQDNPVIIFDDFTASFHWVEFDFKVKSSAMKMLRPKDERCVFKYFYYVMQTIKYAPVDHTRQWIEKYSKFTVPVPPIEVQREIVRILDEYSHKKTELIAALNAELTARKKQYEHYRNELLNVESGIKNVEWKKLNDIFYIRNGYTPSKAKTNYWANGVVPWFRMEDIRKNGRILDDAIQHVSLSAVKSGKCIKAGSLILSTTATIGEHALVNVDCLTNQQITSFTIREYMLQSLNIKYAFYYFFKFGKWCIDNTNNGGSLPIIGLDKLRNYSIPIPPLEEQERIVTILDRFDKLCNDISQGLPSEIEARKKQYEYYRDKLLTFKENAV